MKKVLLAVVAGLLSVQVWALNAEKASLNFGDKVCYFATEIYDEDGNAIRDDFNCDKDEALMVFHYKDAERAKRGEEGVRNKLEEMFGEPEEYEAGDDIIYDYVGMVEISPDENSLAVFIRSGASEETREDVINHLASLEAREKPFMEVLEDIL